MKEQEKQAAPPPAGPVDRLSWTEGNNRFASRPDLKARQRVLWLRGPATPRAKEELTRMGWTVREETLNNK
jgi:hypothetical protein